MLAVVLHQMAENEYLDAILLSFLIVLRAKRVELFHALCDGSLSPEGAMAAIAELPGGQKFVADRPGMLVENERSRAQEMLGFRNRIITGFRHRFDYRNIAAKIDLAASFRD